MTLVELADNELLDEFMAMFRIYRDSEETPADDFRSKFRAVSKETLDRRLIVQETILRFSRQALDQP